VALTTSFTFAGSRPGILASNKNLQVPVAPPTITELVLRHAEPKWPDPAGCGTVGSITWVAVMGSTVEVG
jgi:hypothetical protein